MRANGPIHAFDGFPVWYRDENNRRLQLNIDPNDPFSGIAPEDLPDASQPVSFPDNYPEEAFYMLAIAEMRTNTGERARLVLALEATFVNEVPIDHEQMVFGRVRIRVAGLQPNVEYTVTHPYGTDVFIPTPDRDGLGEINFTEDIGGLSGGEFHLALNSRVYPFLEWDPSVAPDAPIGYVGDPAVDHPVIGSVFTDPLGQPQNYFRIEGPRIGIGSPDRSTTPGIDGDNCIETRNFSLLGKISTISGMDIDRATFTQNDADRGFIDVFASADTSPQNINITGESLTPTLLQGMNGKYFARVPFAGSRPPSSITVTNLSDTPNSIKVATPVDFVSADVTYDTETHTLSFAVTSSDTINPPSFIVEDFGLGELAIPANGLLTMNPTFAPANVTIRSTAGGKRTIPLIITGASDAPIPVQAHAGVDGTVLVGSTVILDGSNSTGIITSFRWTQLEGPAVILTGPNTATPSFTAPNSAATLVFELTVTGEGVPPSRDTVNISVQSAPEPIVQNLTVTRAEYRTRDAEWRIRGISNVLGQGVTVTIFIGNTFSGAVLAQVSVDALGNWQYQIEGSTVLPDATRSFSIQSSAGGTLLNIPLTIRN